MAATVVQSEKVQSWSKQNKDHIDLFRWQKWVDGEGKLWIITCLYGYDNRGRYGANVELLNVDTESPIDVTRSEFEDWVKAGNLKRVDTPILI